MRSRQRGASEGSGSTRGLGKKEKKWQLRFNIEKCKTTHLGGIREGQASYSMERPDGKRVTLQETTEEKDLRVQLDCIVKPTIHMAHTAMKANQLLGLIRRTFHYLDCDLMKRLYPLSGRTWSTQEFYGILTLKKH